MGLRELKKEQTREAIADTAFRLFVERGFDRVPVTEIAREAQVAQATVFNYFPTKEDLFYSRLEALGDRLLDAVERRPAGASAFAAVRGYLLQQGGLLAQAAAGERDALERLRTVNRVIAASPALLAREQQALARVTGELAALLAAETGTAPDDIEAQVAANALVGVHRTLINYVRARVLADDVPVRLATDVREQGIRAFALLEHGLGDYAVKSP
jgi:AcrR family transcriptional regulator